MPPSPLGGRVKELRQAFEPSPALARDSCALMREPEMEPAALCRARLAPWLGKPRCELVRLSIAGQLDILDAEALPDSRPLRAASTPPAGYVADVPLTQATVRLPSSRLAANRPAAETAPTSTLADLVHWAECELSPRRIGDYGTATNFMTNGFSGPFAQDPPLEDVAMRTGDYGTVTNLLANDFSGLFAQDLPLEDVAPRIDGYGSATNYMDSGFSGLIAKDLPLADVATPSPSAHAATALAAPAPRDAPPPLLGPYFAVRSPQTRATTSSRSGCDTGAQTSLNMTAFAHLSDDMLNFPLLPKAFAVDAFRQCDLEATSTTLATCKARLRGALLDLQQERARTALAAGAIQASHHYEREVALKHTAFLDKVMINLQAAALFAPERLMQLCIEGADLPRLEALGAEAARAVHSSTTLKPHLRGS